MTLTIEAHAADQGGCGHYRIIWPAEHVQKQGDVEVRVAHADGELQLKLGMGDEQVTRDGKVLPPQSVVLGLSELPECDVLVLQRPLARLLADAIPFVQQAGIAVVVELDDDFSMIHRQNAAWPHVQPRFSPDQNFLHLQRACSYADMVTVTTPALARKYGKHGRVTVIPNYLPDTFLDVQPAGYNGGTPVRLCWSGTVATHPTDLQQCAAGVAPLVRSGEAELHIIGTGYGVGKRLGLTPDVVDENGKLVTLSPDVHGTDWVPLSEYPQAMGEHHVGLVPLDMIPFNEAKSWLKGLEFAGAGVPFVATATGPYRALHKLGLGVLAERPNDWRRALKRFTDSTQLRLDTGERYANIARSTLMIEQHAHEWAGAWAAALVNRRKAAGKTLVAF